MTTVHRLLDSLRSNEPQTKANAAISLYRDDFSYETWLNVLKDSKDAENQKYALWKLQTYWQQNHKKLYIVAQDIISLLKNTSDDVKTFCISSIKDIAFRGIQTTEDPQQIALARFLLQQDIQPRSQLQKKTAKIKEILFAYVRENHTITDNMIDKIIRENIDTLSQTDTTSTEVTGDNFAQKPMLVKIYEAELQKVRELQDGQATV